MHILSTNICDKRQGEYPSSNCLFFCLVPGELDAAVDSKVGDKGKSVGPDRWPVLRQSVLCQTRSNHVFHVTV
jgi:hypothetical protein